MKSRMSVIDVEITPPKAMALYRIGTPAPASITPPRPEPVDPGDSMSSCHRRVDSEMLEEVFIAAPPARRPTVYFVGGPGEMVIAVRAMLSALDVADDRIYSEDHA